MPQTKAFQGPIKRKPNKSPHPGKIDPATVEDPSMLKAIVMLREALKEHDRTADGTRRFNDQDCTIDEAVIRILREHALLYPVFTDKTASSKD